MEATNKGSFTNMMKVEDTVNEAGKKAEKDMENTTISSYWDKVLEDCTTGIGRRLNIVFLGRALLHFNGGEFSKRARSLFERHLTKW